MQGQFIGKVDPGSAADAAGLRLGDRIVEVNGVNVTDQTHKDVVQRIKAVPNETKLLVIDPIGEQFYIDRNLTISSSMKNVQKLKTPSTPPISQQPNNRPANLQLTSDAPSTKSTNGGPASLYSKQHYDPPKVFIKFQFIRLYLNLNYFLKK